MILEGCGKSGRGESRDIMKLFALGRRLAESYDRYRRGCSQKGGRSFPQKGGFGPWVEENSALMLKPPTRKNANERSETENISDPGIIIKRIREWRFLMRSLSPKTT